MHTRTIKLVESEEDRWIALMSVPWLYYSFARCFHGGKLSKGYNCCVVSYNNVNLQLSKNKRFNFFLKAHPPAPGILMIIGWT